MGRRSRDCVKRQIETEKNLPITKYEKISWRFVYILPNQSRSPSNLTDVFKEIRSYIFCEVLRLK